MQEHRNDNVALDLDRDGLIDTVLPSYGGVYGGVYGAAPVVGGVTTVGAPVATVAPAVATTVAAPVATYGGVRTAGVYGGFTDFNRDGIPDQLEGYRGYGAYGYGYPSTYYGGYGSALYY